MHLEKETALRNLTPFVAVCAASVVLATATSADAGLFRRGGSCAPRCTPCAAVGGHYEEQIVDRTICVPTYETVTNKVTVTVMKPEQRERTYTVCKRVPYTETVTQEYTVMVQKTEMRKATHTVYKPVMREVTQNYTVMVPHQEVRQGVRNVPVCEPVTLPYTVCVDQGHWETREVPVQYGYGYRGPCGSCGGCGHYQGASCTGCGGCGSCVAPPQTRCVRVWVPNPVQVQRTRTVMQTRYVQQPYQYPVTVCRPEERTRTVQVCDRVAEQVTVDVPHTYCVPEKRTRTYDVTKYKNVEETKTQTYCVMVPHQEERDVQTQVCKMVQKVVQEKVRVWVPDAPACHDYGAAGCTTPACETPACTTPAAPAVSGHAF